MALPNHFDLMLIGPNLSGPIAFIAGNQFLDFSCLWISNSQLGFAFASKASTPMNLWF
jgi:hypothetical protein